MEALAYYAHILLCTSIGVWAVVHELHYPVMRSAAWKDTNNRHRNQGKLASRSIRGVANTYTVAGIKPGQTAPVNEKKE